MGHFDHFHHERGTTTLQVVTGAGTCEHTVNQSDFCVLSGNKATRLGKHADKRYRSQVRGFSSHVRAGDEQEVSLRVHDHVVGDEAGLCFQDGVPCALQFDDVLVGHVGFGPTSLPTDRCKALEDVD